MNTVSKYKLQMVKESTYEFGSEKHTTPDKVFEFLKNQIGSDPQENMVMLCYNNQNELLSYHEVHKGTADRSIVSPRDIFTRALLSNATRVIMAHNHPGGSLKASRADLKATEVLIEAGNLLQIDVLDHIIVTSEDYTSIRGEHGGLWEDY